MKVCFRQSKHNGSIVIDAIFLEEISHHSKLELLCYSRIGQHSGCSLEWLYNETKPASKDQYSSLLKELQSIGYDELELVERLLPFHLMVQNICIMQHKLNLKREVKND